MAPYLTRHGTAQGPRWALDGNYLPTRFGLNLLLELPAEAVPGLLEGMSTGEPAEDPLLPPLEPSHEVWGSGVTYQRSREARQAESGEADAYEKIYDAERPELFLKAVGWRVVGHGHPVRVRADSHWNVPEPELVVVANRHLEVVGYTAGNDVSSRDIEGENTLYLPQAKIYDGSCSLGPGIILNGPDALSDIPIQLSIQRDGATIFEGSTHTSQMKRRFEELVTYLGRELTFPGGAFLMTGAGIVPPDDFNLEPEDVVQITVGELTLENKVTR